MNAVDGSEFGEGVVVEREVRGTRLRLAAYNRAMSLCARMNYETENLDFIDSMESGSVLYDLGACEGRFSIYAALRGLRVYAFEPESMNFAALLDNRRFNGPIAAENLVAINAGVGAEGCTATLKVGQPWPGGHQKVLDHGPGRRDLAFEFSGEQSVRVEGLDAVIAREGWPPPCYMKVDIDGSELPFLRGAAETLSNPGLKGVIFELCRSDPSDQTVRDHLARAGLEAETEYKIETDLYNVLFRRIQVSRV
jgi:FkbM family methyltransferase